MDSFQRNCRFRQVPGGHAVIRDTPPGQPAATETANDLACLLADKHVGSSGKPSSWAGTAYKAEASRVTGGAPKRSSSANRALSEMSPELTGTLRSARSAPYGRAGICSQFALHPSPPLQDLTPLIDNGRRSSDRKCFLGQPYSRRQAPTSSFPGSKTRAASSLAGVRRDRSDPPSLLSRW